MNTGCNRSLHRRFAKKLARSRQLSDRDRATIAGAWAEPEHTATLLPSTLRALHPGASLAVRRVPLHEWSSEQHGASAHQCSWSADRIAVAALALLAVRGYQPGHPALHRPGAALETVAPALREAHRLGLPMGTCTPAQFLQQIEAALSVLTTPPPLGSR